MYMPDTLSDCMALSRGRFLSRCRRFLSRVSECNTMAIELHWL